MLDFLEEHKDHMNRMIVTDFSYLSEKNAKRNQKQTLESIFLITSDEDKRAIENACISGKLNIKNVPGIHPSVISGELGHGTIGTLGSINRSCICAKDKD